MLFSLANVSPASAAAVTLQQGTATWSQPIGGNYPVDYAVDGIIDGNGWAIAPNQGTDQIAVFETSTDINASRLDFALYHTWGSSHNLGRFRISYTTDDRSLFADGLNSGGNVTANWTVLTGATISSIGGETFTILGDNSILVSGNNPATTVYSVSFAGSFNGITGIRLEALSDASLPSNGPGRGGGNFVLSEITLDATPPTPLDDGGWELVAHMSNSGGMFDGNGELMPGYAYGTFNSNPVASTPDFQRAFPVVADKILFITGDLSIWGIADYGDLRALIDAQGSVPPFSPNLAFEIGVNGVVSNTTGNVISRAGALEDPWISMEGDHFYGVDNQRIVWGENNWNFAPGHVALKNNHGGINVYIMSGNESPTANAGGSYSGNEGSAIAMSGATASDPDIADTLIYAWSVDSALCSFDDAGLLTPNLTCSDNGNFTATLEVSDGTETNGSDAAITVQNVAPTLGTISVDQALVPVNTAINASADFTDPGLLDTHSAAWDWGNGSSAGTVTQGTGSGSVGDSHSYDTPGVYTVKLTVTDNDNDTSNESVYQYVVVYDPSGGFVTGGGWIDSPAGAYTADPYLTGRANFGFVAKYKKGANVPDGNTQFQFKAGDLNFHSSSYQWLVVAGARAQFKGEGTINGAGNYGFMLTAIDGAINGGGGADKFRIKIWDMDNGDAVVYDNLVGGADDADPTTLLGGGSIVIHK